MEELGIIVGVLDIARCVLQLSFDSWKQPKYRFPKQLCSTFPRTFMFLKAEMCPSTFCDNNLKLPFKKETCFQYGRSRGYHNMFSEIKKRLKTKFSEILSER